MNNLDALFAQPFFHALALALIHFIWQGALLAALYAGLDRLLRRSSANARYVLACAALLLMLIFPLATFYLSFDATRSLNAGPTFARTSSGKAIPQKTIPAPEDRKST